MEPSDQQKWSDTTFKELSQHVRLMDEAHTALLHGELDTTSRGHVCVE